MSGSPCKACSGRWPRTDHFIADCGQTRAYLHEDQFFTGWTVLVLKRHATELFHLSRDERASLVEEVALVASHLAKEFRAIAALPCGPTMNPSGSFSPLRIPKVAGISLLRTVPVHVLGSLAILVFSAGFYVKTVWGEVTWLTIGSWSLLTVYVLVGLAGGIAGGLLSAAHRTLDAVESALHAGLGHLPALTQNPGREPFSIDEARTHYAALLDRILNQTLGYLPLPAWLERMIRSSIHDTMVADFITLCQERGLTRVPPQEFRNWVLAKGATLALSPLRDQISLWQYALFGLIGLLAAGALLLSYFAA